VNSRQDYEVKGLRKSRAALPLEYNGRYHRGRTLERKQCFVTSSTEAPIGGDYWTSTPGCRRDRAILMKRQGLVARLPTASVTSRPSFPACLDRSRCCTPGKMGEKTGRELVDLINRDGHWVALRTPDSGLRCVERFRGHSGGMDHPDEWL
jgi:hypothetical protein